MKILSKIVAILLFLTAHAAEDTTKNLLLQRKLSNECLLELVNGDYTNGKIFDVQSYMRKPPFEKKDYPPGSEEDLTQYYQERYINSFDGWEYVGAVEPYHIILTHMMGDTWRTDVLLVLKFVKNGITVISTIGGCKKSSLTSAKLKGNTLEYTQATTGEGLFAHTAKIDPQLLTLFPEICGDLKDCRNDHAGDFTIQCSLDGKGLLGPDQIISFYPAEGWPPYSGKEYKPTELKELVIRMCKDKEPVTDPYNE